MPLDATTMPTADIAPTTEPDLISARPPPRASLAAVARRDMEVVFAGGHRPSASQWAAIEDYLDTVERAANGGLDHAIYLSAIPPGTGKSVAVQAISRAISNSPDHAHVGVLIAVNRLAEAQDMAGALKDQWGKMCVLTGRNSEAMMQPLGGRVEADAAQIVITTQAALKETLRRSQDFDAAERYFFRGERRRVVLWDEAISMNRPVVLNGDDVLKLARTIRLQSPEAATALKRWATDLDNHPAGLCAVPDFNTLGVDFTRLEADAASDEVAAQARVLSIVSGVRAHVLRSNANASSLVSYVPELPPSLLPVIVTDASAARGVHHGSYEMMAQKLDVRRLKEAEKTYSNLTIRRVATSASRSTYRKQRSHEGRDLIEMIVRYIKSVAPAPVVVVSYKTWMTIYGVREHTIRDAINARLTPAERHRVRHVTWGSHTASNAHRDVTHMIFAGLHFTSLETAYAASGAALGKSMNTEAAEDHPTAEQVKVMDRGMLRDSTLQAVLRGAARTGVDGDCARQEVVIPARPQTGLTDAEYLAMFPGCVIVRDTTLLPLKPLKGRLKRMAEAVAQRQETGEEEITDASLYGALNIGKTAYAALKKKPEWTAWHMSQGWHKARLSGRQAGLRRQRGLTVIPKVTLMGKT